MRTISSALTLKQGRLSVSVKGAQLKKFRDGLSLNYEINLGISFNWNHYDATDRPYFEAIGSRVNAHLGGNLYLKKSLSKRLDLYMGFDFLHFSNGAQRCDIRGPCFTCYPGCR